MYPTDDGTSVFQRDPKLKAELDKEIQKGQIRLPDPNLPQDVDDDQDARIDRVVKEVWLYYDKKNLGFIDKVRRHFAMILFLHLRFDATAENGTAVPEGCT